MFAGRDEKTHVDVVGEMFGAAWWGLCMNVKIDDPVLAVCWVQCLGGWLTSGPRRSARQPAQTSWSRDGLGGGTVTITILS